MSLDLALVAGAVEAGVGYPDRLYRLIGHPVTWIGRLITWADDQWNSDEDSETQQRMRGIMLVLCLVVGGLLVGLLISRIFYLLLPPLVALLAAGVVTSSLLAQRSLHGHVEAVADALGRNLDKGREAVAMIVGRDTKHLDQSGICRAAIESLAESFCDGVVAPMLWIVVAGLPGGLAYKAVNTADSMIGHKTERYIDFGWAAAKTDDLLNWPAARLSALWLILAAVILPGGMPFRAIATTWRDSDKHDSPNAGWPEAAMAGALGMRLMGPRSYDGELVNKDWMNKQGRLVLTAADIRTALKLYRIACALQLGVVAILLLLLLLM